MAVRARSVVVSGREVRGGSGVGGYVRGRGRATLGARGAILGRGGGED